MPNKAENSYVTFHPDQDHVVMVCDICGDAGRQYLLVSCSRCKIGAEHTYCMKVMLDKVPEDEWFCQDCKLEFDAHKEKTERLKSTIEGRGNDSKAGIGPCTSLLKSGVDNRREIDPKFVLRENSSERMDVADEKYGKHPITENNDNFSSHGAMSITASSRVHQLIPPKDQLSRSSTYSDRRRTYKDSDKDGLCCTLDKSVWFRTASSVFSNIHSSKFKELSPSVESSEVKHDTGNYPSDKRSSFRSALGRASMSETTQPATLSCKDSVCKLNKKSFLDAEKKLKDYNLNSRVPQPALASPKSVLCVKCDGHHHAPELCAASDLQLALIRSRAANSSKERSNKTTKLDKNSEIVEENILKRKKYDDEPENALSTKRARSDCGPLTFDLNEICSTNDMLLEDERCVPSFEADSGSTNKFSSAEDVMPILGNNVFRQLDDLPNCELTLEMGSRSDKIFVSDERNDSPNLSLSIALPDSSGKQTAQLKLDQLPPENKPINSSILLFGKLIKM